MHSLMISSESFEIAIGVLLHLHDDELRFREPVHTNAYRLAVRHCHLADGGELLIAGFGTDVSRVDR